MKQPSGFKNASITRLICKLQKALYGLKQPLRSLYQKLSGAIIDIGFTNSKADPNMFFKKVRSKLAMMLIYIDGILLTGSNDKFLYELVLSFNKKFSLNILNI